MRVTTTRALAPWLGLAAFAVVFGAQAGPQEDYRLGLKAYQEEDLITAMRLLRKSANEGNSSAQVLLAYILDKAEDNAQALALYTAAAEKGDPEGQFGLAEMYAAGEGTERDNEKAIFWYKRAAEGAQMRATLVLALAYLEGGLGLQPDRAVAIEWLKRGAAQGYAPAASILSRLDGQGVGSAGGDKTQKQKQQSAQ